MQMSRDDALRDVRVKWLRVQSEVAYLRMLFAGQRFREALRREDERDEKYRPDQPRVPAGNSDGGQWTDEGRGGGASRDTSTGQVLSDANPDNLWQPGTQVAIDDTGNKKPGIGHNKPPSPIGNDPPAVPNERPSSRRDETRIAKEVAKGAAKNLARRAGWLGAIFTAAEWLSEYASDIRSYQDSPRSLEELKSLVSSPQAGYNIHHIAEQTPSRQDGFPEDLIDGPDNLVRVPTYRHQDITGWYARGNEEFGGRPPREYLRGKSWEERQRIGIQALIKHGVLKP